MLHSGIDLHKRTVVIATVYTDGFEAMALPVAAVAWFTCHDFVPTCYLR